MRAVSHWLLNQQTHGLFSKFCRNAGHQKMKVIEEKFLEAPDQPFSVYWNVMGKSKSHEQWKGRASKLQISGPLIVAAANINDIGRILALFFIAMLPPGTEPAADGKQKEHFVSAGLLELFTP